MLDLIVVTNEYQYTRKWLGDQGLHPSFRTEELKVSVFGIANLHRFRDIPFAPGDRMFVLLNQNARDYVAFANQVRDVVSSCGWPEVAVHFQHI